MNKRLDEPLRVVIVMLYSKQTSLQQDAFEGIAKNCGKLRAFYKSIPPRKYCFRHIACARYTHAAGLLLEFFSQKESDYKLTTFEAAYGRPCDETDRHTVVVDNFRVAHFAWKSPEEDFERELDNLLSMVCKDRLKIVARYMPYAI